MNFGETKHIQTTVARKRKIQLSTRTCNVYHTTDYLFSPTKAEKGWAGGQNETIKQKE
jgi:hypothetical protein